MDRRFTTTTTTHLHRRTVKAGVANADVGERVRLSAIMTTMATSISMSPTTWTWISTTCPSSATGVLPVSRHPVNCGPRGLKAAATVSTTTMATAPLPMSRRSSASTRKLLRAGVLWLDYDKDGARSYVSTTLAEPLYTTIARVDHRGRCRGRRGLQFRRANRPHGHRLGDYDRDGWPDIAKNNFSTMTTSLSQRSQWSSLTAGAAGVGAISNPYLGFGVKFLDYDNDAGRHFHRQRPRGCAVEGQSFGVGYAEQPFLFHNLSAANRRPEVRRSRTEIGRRWPEIWAARP